MDEVTKLKLQWAEETHRMQMAKKDEEIKFDRLQREKAEWELNTLQEALQREQQQKEEARTARGTAVESFLKFQRSGGAEGRDALDEALVGMSRADPEFTRAFRNVVEGAVEAIQAPVEEKRGEALFQLKERLASAQILSERAQAEQRKQLARKTAFEGDLAQVERDEAYLMADAEEARTKRYEKAKLAAINDTYLEIDVFGGIEGARQRFRDARDNAVKSAIERRSGIMQRLGGLRETIDFETIMSGLRSSPGGDYGTKLDSRLRELGKEPATETEKELVEQVASLDEEIRVARQNYENQINYLDTIDNVTNDLFDELVNEQGYSIAEARTQVPSAVVELQKHLEPMLENVLAMQTAGEKITFELLMNEYNRYIMQPSHTLKPVHKDLLKKAFLKAAYGQEKKVEKSFMSVWGSDNKIIIEEE
jgi:hypothetical protein